MEGLKAIESELGPHETMDRLEAAVRARGMTVFARVDHTAGAAQAGLELRPTVLLVFGSARAGTPLMQVDQTMGIDLPLRALVWEDAQRVTWLGYVEPRWLVDRHGIAAKGNGVVGEMTSLLETLARSATRAT